MIGPVYDVGAAPSSPDEWIEPALQEKVDATVGQILVHTGVPSASIALVRDQAGTHRQHAAAAVLQDGPVPERITPSLLIAIALIRP